ncbi:MAG: hypothetical protein WAV40_04670 [Microgenomates group bacterium]
MINKSAEFEKSILPSYLWSRPFSDPGCSASDSNFFDFFWFLQANKRALKIKPVLVKVGDNTIPTVICNVIRKTSQFNLPTYLVLSSTDSRLPGMILGRSLRTARPLYRDAHYIEKYGQPLSPEASNVIEQYGLFGSILQTMGMLTIIANNTFIENINTFSDWVNSERPFHVQRTWGNN